MRGEPHAKCKKADLAISSCGAHASELAHRDEHVAALNLPHACMQAQGKERPSPRQCADKTRSVAHYFQLDRVRLAWYGRRVGCGVFGSPAVALQIELFRAAPAIGVA